VSKLFINRRSIVRLTLAAIVWGVCGWLPAIAQNTSDNALLYELLQRIELLERELRQLRGDLELFQYQQQRQTGSAQTDDARYQAIERRLQSLEQTLNAADISVSTPAQPPQTSSMDSAAGNFNFNNDASSSTTSPQLTIPRPERSDDTLLPPPQPSTSTPSVSPTPDQGPEQDAYKLALERLRAGNYQQAIASFESFIATYPNSALTGNAYYWLGEAHYINRDYEQAKQAFLTMGAQYSASDKLPDALLKLGYIYSELGEPARAKQVLSKLIEAFPRSNAANLAQKHMRLLQ
jgi:tol-pal system protein YbgF